jgi:hypothetical protein
VEQSDVATKGNLAETTKLYTKIYNFSNRKLNQTEIDILLKGFKFTPTPVHKNNICEINKDIDEFHRSLRLKEYFSNYNNEHSGHTPISIVKNKTFFCPPKNRNVQLEHYIDATKKLCVQHSQSENKIKHNITLNERNAIESLTKDKSIIIKEADKGGGIVIMNSLFYKTKILEMLNNSEYYRHISSDNSHITFDKIRKLVNGNKKLTVEERDFLIKFDYKASSFYGLPKIHKSKIIQDKVKQSNTEYIELQDPEDLTFRPIVAGPICETSRLSHMLDLLLKPFVQKVDSNIKNNIDFLKCIPAEVPENTILTSFDVVNLYSNIPHNLGLQSIEYWLNRFPELLNNRFSQSFITESIKIILENNNFIFDDKHYSQTKGTAMGTKFAPTYATLVMGFLEQKLYEEIESLFDNEFLSFVKASWKRYLDDCFIFWVKYTNELQQFHTVLNNLHPDIKFTIQSNTVNLPFLDILIIKDNKTIYTDIYYKETDSKQYLNFSSCHSKHTKINIPFTLAKRICTIVSNEELKLKRLKELEISLIDRNYPKSVITKGFQKALSISRQDLLSEESKDKTDNVIPFISTHNPKNKEIFGVLKNGIDALKNDSVMNRALANTRIIKCKRQPPNLKRLLTKSTFTSHEPQVSKCHDSRCALCNYIIEGNSFNFNGKLFKIKTSMSCDVKNVIYVLVCTGCNQIYIGQTGDMLRHRRTVHEQQMRDPSTRQMPLSKHLDECSKSEPKFKIFPFYKLFTNSVSARLAKEEHFINVFQPQLNFL